MESTYLIKNPPHELLVEAIKNPPKDPERIYLKFLADNVKIPWSNSKEEELTNYLKLCKEGNIIPFSSKEVNYDYEVKEHIPKHSEGARRFFGGGRTNSVLIDMNVFLEEERLKKFNEILFPSLLENNYKVSEGHLTLEEHEAGSDYDKGYDPHFQIRINWPEKGLGLLLDEEHIYNKENIEKYVQWFTDLKKKFSV